MERERYRILPHTADGKFQAYGRTLEEAFGNAALALSSLMWDWTAVEPKARLAVRITGADREQLLIKFLGEVIYLFETRQFLLARVDGLKIRPAPKAGWLGLEADLSGDTASDRHELYGDVKAVTYHDLKIEECDGVTVQVVVDM